IGLQAYISARTLSIAWSRLIEHTSDQIDLPVLQFLRRAVRSFSFYPNGDPFNVGLALRKCRDFTYPAGCPFVPDGVIARQRKDECPVGIEGAHSFALGPE